MNRMKIVRICLLIGLCLSLHSWAQTDPFRIGLVIDGSWGENAAMLESIQEEILALTTGEFEVRFPEAKILQADWQLDAITAAVDKLLADPEVDMVITQGVISSHIISTRGSLPKPVIAPFIIDRMLQNLPIAEGKSGILNLNYISIPSAIEQDMNIFREIVPFQKLAILLNPHLLESFPDAAASTANFFRKMGIETELIGVGSKIKESVALIPEEAEAVYILPLPYLSDDDFKVLSDELIERKLPSFASAGAERVEMGILAGLNRDVLRRIARRVAINVQRILLGDTPESINVAISLNKQLTINEATARAIGVYPSWAVITEAELVGREQRPVDRVLNMNRVVQEAVAANLDLSAKQYWVDAGKRDVSLAMANLFPSIDLLGTQVIIDKDRAEASMGMQAERTLTGSATLSQIIFSEPVWANLSIQKSIQKTRELELDQLRLDIAQQAVTAYLNLMRAKSYETIQQENLKLTRKNLELARVREIIGSAGPAEVYRWDSEIALNRTNVIQANAQRNLAEIQVNRLLHRQAEESFLTLEIDMRDPILITSHDELFIYIENKEYFRVFRRFMVEEGMRNSPELAALDAAIAAQKRALRSFTHSFYTPTLALQAGMDNVFSRKGAGTEGFSLPPDLGFDLAFPEQKDFSWNVAFSLSFPLFKGGEKFAARQKASLELTRLKTERDAIAEKIEQRIRSALHLAGASYASIKQVRLAAHAAHKSLDVVQDAYSQGMVSIVDLIDVQNNVLLTDQLAANAVYDFLIDLMEVERAIGTSDFFATDEEREAFLQRARNYFTTSGLSLMD